MPTTTPSRTIVHLSDTHILPTDDDRLHGVDTMANLRLALDNIEQHGARPDAIVISGDLANGGELDSYRRLRVVLDDARKQFGVPVLPAMGNHDARGPFRQGLLGVVASDEPYHYVTWVGGLRVVVLDSTVPGAAHGELDRVQLEWLREELTEPALEGTLIVLHHPPIPGPVQVINYLVLQNPAALAETIQGTDVLAVLAGHAHHPIAGTFAGVLCFAAPATAYTVDPLAGDSSIRGIEGPGFGLVHLYDRTVVASATTLTADARELYVHQVGSGRDQSLDRTRARGVSRFMTTATQPVRRLGLAGTYNLRDVGGYRTHDGRYTRWRTLLRSDSLHRLAPPEQATLLGLGLRTVIDLRSERELSEAPNVFAASDSVRYLSLPLVPGGGEVRTEFPSLEVLYRLIVNTRAAELAAIVTTLAAPGAMPALVHCTAGKDRTGFVIALLLRLAGVDADTIAADYHATEACLAGEFMVDFRRRTEARGIDWQAYEPLLGCPPEFMLSLLAYVDETYGGIEAYLIQAGVAAAELTQLHAGLVE